MANTVLYTIKYKCLSGAKKGKVCDVEMFAATVKEARMYFRKGWKKESIISIKKNVAYNNNARIKNKAMVNKRTYKKMINKSSSKRKNTERGTAMSTKKYKIVMMKRSAKKPTKSGIKYTSASPTAVNKMITDFRKKCGCAIKWQLYTYRSSLRAYRLSKASR
jgi:hypothetical protein